MSSVPPIGSAPVASYNPSDPTSGLTPGEKKMLENFLSELEEMKESKTYNLSQLEEMCKKLEHLELTLEHRGTTLHLINLVSNSIVWAKAVIHNARTEPSDFNAYIVNIFVGSIQNVLTFPHLP